MYRVRVSRQIRICKNILKKRLEFPPQMRDKQSRRLVAQLLNRCAVGLDI